MSFGINGRVGLALGLGNLLSYFSGYGRDQEFINLATENNNNLVQEDGGFILV
jgi:hypothetical protein